MLENQEAEQTADQLIPEGLNLSVVEIGKNLSGIVTVEDINYSEGVGFAQLTLRVDGIEAEILLT